jgi:hypothetical protein
MTMMTKTTKSSILQPHSSGITVGKPMIKHQKIWLIVLDIFLAKISFCPGEFHEQQQQQRRTNVTLFYC